MPDEALNDTPTDGPFADLLAEILQAEEQGQAPDLERYLASFPDLEPRLGAYFRDREAFERLAAHLAPTPPGRGVGDSTPPRDASAPPPLVLKPGMRFGGYEILEELGRGGMGVVYKARQLTPERLVALKVIRTDRLEGLSEQERRQWIDRFHREAQLVAGLDQHPHIVTLYEVGDHEGQPYFTMQLVAGGSLAQRLRPAGGADAAAGDRRVRGQRDNARLLAEAARAVEYAHRRGVLHRDLKPGNILLDTEGRPLVGDFGLARRLDETGSLVTSGIEGTAAYMAPEQARAAKGAMTTAADVYGLGAILYEALTGRPPFRGNNDLETLLAVLDDEPAHPRALNRRLSRDLATVCLKCLEKEPSRRYPSAAALAEDLDNWVEGRPINARPVGAAGRLWRWCRRNPFPAGAGAVAALTFVVAFVLVSLSLYRTATLAKEKGDLAENNGRLAVANGALAADKQKEADRATQEADNAKTQSRNARREATMLAYQQATALCDQGLIDQGMHALAHGVALAEQAKAPDLERLFRLNLAAWRWRLHTQRAVLPHAAGVSAVAFSPDGRTAATACWDHTTRLWDAISGKPLGKPVTHDGWVTGLAFSPDGKALLVVAYHTVEVWDVAAGRRLAELNHQDIGVTSAAFGPDGRTVLTGALDGQARLWDVAGQKLIGEPAAHHDWITAVACGADGRVFVTAGKRGGIQVWEASTRRPLASFQHPAGVTALALSPDGRTVLTGGADRTARLWDVESGKPLGNPLPHAQEVTSAAFSPDGVWVLTGCLDRAARLWDVATGEVVGQPLAHPGEVLAVAFGPDGRTLLTGQGRAEGDARLWDAAPGELLGGPMAHADSILAVAVTPDSRRVATAGRDKAVRLWDADTGEPVGEALLHNNDVNALAFSPDGSILLTGGDNGTALFWQATDGKPVTRELQLGGAKFLDQLAVGGAGASMLRGMGDVERPRDRLGEPFWGPARGSSSLTHSQRNAVFTLAFSPDGKSVAVGGGDGCTLFDPQRGALGLSLRLEVREKAKFGGLGPPRAHPPVYAAAFTPDGRLVATAGGDGAVRLWDSSAFDVETVRAKARAAKDPRELNRLYDEIGTAKLVAGPFQQDGAVVALAFSPDGRTLLTGGADKVARLWDVATGNSRRLEHQGPVVALAFSPNGRVCVTGSWDGTARLWETATGDPIGQPLPHRGKVRAVAFSCDGGLVLTAGEEQTARLWDAATGEPVGPPLRQRDQVRAVAFRPDGRAFVTAGDDGTALLWAAPVPAPGASERLRLWVEACTGQTRAPDGAGHFLEPARWDEALARLADSDPPPVPPVDVVVGRRRGARAAEASGRWYAARWNLDRLIEADPRNGRYYLRRGKARLELGDLAGARADWDRAVDLTPEEWGAWFQRGWLAVRSRQWQRGIDDFSKALELAPRAGALRRGPADGRTAAILHGRAYARAGLGQWKESAGDLAQVIPTPFAETTPEQWIDYAVVLLKLGDAKGYGALCRGMLDKFANPTDEFKTTVVTREYGRQEALTFGKPFDPRNVVAMTWACSLSPDALPDWTRSLQLARKAAALRPKDYPCARALGAALYRAGQGEEAVRQLEAASALQKSSPSTWLFLAMAHQKAGRGDKAKEWLDKTRAWIEQARKPKPEGAADKNDPSWDDLPWSERAALEVLQGEAEKLIDKGLAKP